MATAQPEDVFKAAAACRAAGDIEGALGRLRAALRRGNIHAEGIEKAGRAIRRDLLSLGDRVKPLRILLLGQCTTSWLASSLTASAWGHGAAALVDEGGYDNVVQELMSLGKKAERPDVLVLLPWTQRLLEAASGRPAVERVADELDLWRRAWELASGPRILQVGYDWVTPGALGLHLSGPEGGDLALVRQVNAELRAALPPGGYFLDLEAVSGMMGRETFYDPRRYHWSKQPFSEAGVARLGECLWAGVQALTTGPKKVLALDLDNTLWGGVVGETGPLGIALGDGPDGEAFRAFQLHIKQLAARGILLAVASKNNPDDAREPFTANPEMVLRLEDFAAFEANWDPKAVTLERAARDLNLGLDSFVFFDDNPAEREQVRQGLPAVEVVEVPEDPAEYVRALEAGLWFEATSLTREDRERTGQYVVERKRRELQQSFASMDDYLRSLEMVADLRPIDDADLPRVVQLLAKTNQFNLTTRRHTREDLLALLARQGAIALTLRVVDRFGDHGLVSVLIGVPDEDRTECMRIDTWLMSCRVIARTVEQFLFGAFLQRCQALGYCRILGEYIPTKKNALVTDLYDGLSFRRVDQNGDDTVRYLLDIDGARPPVTFLSEKPFAAS
jgi:FkbH-like protein